MQTSTAITKTPSRGFTLIEIMVSLGLVSILVGIIGTVFSHASKVYTQGEARIQIYQNARIAIEKMELSITTMESNAHPRQHLILANMYANTHPRMNEGDTEPMFEQADALFFYGTVYIQNEAKTGYILYRLGDFDDDTKSYQLKMYVIPTKNIGTDVTDSSTFGKLIDNDGSLIQPLADFEGSESAGTVEAATALGYIYADELCQYVKSLRIKYVYSDVWDSQLALLPDTAQGSRFATPLNLLPYETSASFQGSLAPGNISPTIGGIGDNDYNFVDSSDYSYLPNNLDRMLKDNWVRFLKRREAAVGNTDVADKFPPFWIQLGGVDSTSSVTSEIYKYSGSGGNSFFFSPKPMSPDLLINGLLNPMEDGVKPFRMGPMLSGDNLRPNIDDSLLANTVDLDNTITLLRFKVHDDEWEDPILGGYSPDSSHPLGEDADDDGFRDYNGNAIRMQGGADSINDRGTNYYIVKPLPNAIEITMRVVDKFNHESRIIQAFIQIPSD